MPDNSLRKLQSFRDALDSQDAILREAMAATPNYAVSVPAARPIKAIFDEILAAFPGLIQSFNYHGNPHGLRAQIAGARRKVQDNITAIEQEAVEGAQWNESGVSAPSALASPLGRKIFIGHGRSLLWHELKDFIETRLRMQSDEFNREPTAGLFTGERLTEMLDGAAFALLVMTGEDEQPDGKVRARENVVHEAGLFQGRLGFQRAIILLEDGCETFSNVDGLTVIRFPRGRISASFEDIRRTLEREGILRT
jgi:predicted nucleotide-binding protein